MLPPASRLMLWCFNRTCRFLNERLSYGMAPDDIVGVFSQRSRWAMGALTILAVSRQASAAGASSMLVPPALCTLTLGRPPVAVPPMQRDNPLCKPGLSMAAALTFFEAAAYHLLSIPTIFMSMVPLVYIFSNVSPLVCNQLWEFAAVFCP